MKSPPVFDATAGIPAPDSISSAPESLRGSGFTNTVVVIFSPDVSDAMRANSPAAALLTAGRTAEAARVKWERRAFADPVRHRLVNERPLAPLPLAAVESDNG